MKKILLGDQVFKNVCEKCSYEWYTSDDDGHKYCPHCGARETKVLLPNIDTLQFFVYDENAFDELCDRCKSEGTI